ncbi:DUF6911 family protein [Pectobacterium odoriferum]|uniref:DUF6911 family protein n=1 Tax=Pectobacterium odoriferum TaxID=78398 RepID=UPI000501344D|nr:hypothetical protein [Pectobacterium odoriferum]AIU88623.1 hypothetical protein BCS7_11105 [Pectobacterium odoriferum]KGA38401.1 hypothetical protein KS43_02240 [Pectobacterium odoriferum]MBA0186917.1 hypothetical protein [Pectobacterium odoriferum]POE14426.1 hypothetical protein BV918_22150 [Pectobacterium odoriferum]POE30873.1 hypothetical protein BV922_20430 [Pectobacterium odoriferum]
MKEEFEADFYLFGKESFTRVRRPEWDDIKELLLKLKGKAGSTRLSILPDPEIGPSHLNVSTDNGFYLCTLLEYTKDDSDVRSYWDMSVSDKKILIYGDYWPERQLTKDFDLVVRIFKEFFDTGNVSTELLN